MKQIEALAIGGPIDGEWITMDNYVYVVPMVAPFKITDGEKFPEIASIIRHEYYAEPINILGIDIWVAIEREIERSYPRDKDAAIAKAIFQRDVATRILKKR